MKPAFELFLATCILPLIEAINANTAAIAGKSCAGTASGSTKPATVTAVVVDEENSPSEEDLIAHAKTIPAADKPKVVAWMKKNLKAESFSELKTGADRAKMLAQLVKGGATDSRVAAPAEDTW